METKNHVLTDIDYQVLAEWRYRSRRFMSFSATAAEAEGLPPQQHQALLAIKASGPDKLMTVGTLAERLVVAPILQRSLPGVWLLPVWWRVWSILPTAAATHWS